MKAYWWRGFAAVPDIAEKGSAIGILQQQQDIVLILEVVVQLYNASAIGNPQCLQTITQFVVYKLV